ncbi:MAG: hypothetical protein RIQ81_1671 [Pseudomonadota bacterium]|jgi:hypothetical protein
MSTAKVPTQGSKTGSIPIRSTDDGIHLANSILWFDSQTNGQLSFVSSADVPSKVKVPQIIATEETLKLMAAQRSGPQKPNALVCQYNRPFSIGRLRMELLPSGGILGGASLYVETEQGRLLYAPFLQTQKSGTVRQMQLKKAHTLILNAYHPDPNQALPNRKKERDRFVDAVKSAVSKGLTPTILCRPTAVAQELTKILSDEGVAVAVHPVIYKIHKVYETCGSPLGKYSLYSARGSQRNQKPVIWPAPTKPGHFRSKLPEGPVFLIEQTAGESYLPPALRRTVERFYFSHACDGVELREVIAAVAPRELYFTGPYAKRYVEEMKSVCPKVRPLFQNDQPTLF